MLARTCKAWHSTRQLATARGGRFDDVSERGDVRLEVEHVAVGGEVVEEGGGRGGVGHEGSAALHERGVEFITLQPREAEVAVGDRHGGGRNGWVIHVNIGLICADDNDCVLG